MNRQWTSQKSFFDNQPVLEKIGDKVLSLITNCGDEGITNHEIAEELHIQTATISGITRPLVLKEIVKECGKRTCKITGNTAIAWKLKTI